MEIHDNLYPAVRRRVLARLKSSVISQLFCQMCWHVDEGASCMLNLGGKQTNMMHSVPIARIVTHEQNNVSLRSVSIREKAPFIPVISAHWCMKPDFPGCKITQILHTASTRWVPQLMCGCAPGISARQVASIQLRAPPT